MKRVGFILLLFFYSSLAKQNHLHAQDAAADAARLRISLLTCTPGEELYSTFGHSALRVIDSNAVADLVYNFGTFDFNDPDFYTKFIRGKLLYSESVSSYQDFIYEYQETQRGITEQVLDLSRQEKIQIYRYLNATLASGERFYKYDFFLDNCTTRLRDILEKYKTPPPVLPAVMPTHFTFRNAIHKYLDANHKDWSKLGIDLLLGAPCDAVMTVRQQQFLPDNLMFALDATQNEKYVIEKRNLLSFENGSLKKHAFTPLVCSSILLLLFGITWLLSKKKPGAKTTLFVLDGLLFFFTGALGLLLLFMMTGTDHSMTKANWNLMWALPTNTFFAFSVSSQKRPVKIYFAATAVIALLCLLFWPLLPQKLNIALIPIVFLVVFRAAAKGFNF